MLARVQTSLTLAVHPIPQQRCLLVPERRALLAVPPSAANGVPPDSSGNAANGEPPRDPKAASLKRLKALETRLAHLKSRLDPAELDLARQCKARFTMLEAELRYVEGDLDKVLERLNIALKGNTPRQQNERERILALASRQAKLAEDAQDLKNWYVGLASLLLFLAASAGTALALIELLGHSAKLPT